MAHYPVHPWLAVEAISPAVGRVHRVSLAHTGRQQHREMRLQSKKENIGWTERTRNRGRAVGSRVEVESRVPWRRMESWLLDATGIGRDWLRLAWVSGSEAPKITEVVADFTEEIRDIGHSPFKEVQSGD